MRFLTPFIATCLIFISACFCKPTNADLLLNFSSNNGASFANDFEVQTGDSLTIGVFLQQTDTDTVLTDEGLIAWGFDLTRTTTNLGTIPSRSVDSAFDVQNRDITTATGFEWEYGESAGLGIRGNAIQLGSFQYDSTADGETIFVVEDRLVGSGIANATWFTSSFTDLDEQIFGNGATSTYQFSVNSISSIPEPSSLLMLSCIAVLSTIRRRRKIQIRRALKSF